MMMDEPSEHVNRDKLTESCFDKRVMLLPKTFILLSGPLNFEPATLKKKAVREVNYRLNT